MRNKQKQGQLRYVQDVIDIIGGRWRGAILASLCDRDKRFNELRRDLGDITPRTLTKELKYLEMNKLINRDEGSNGPIGVLYSLTEHGHSLKPLIAGIVEWGHRHREIILTDT